MQGNLEIKEGDALTISAQGIRVSGEVISARHWGDRDGWYIELTNANVPGGYSYWKQGIDGGRIVSLNGTAVDSGTSGR